MTQASLIPKVPIYHCSLTRVYEECPTCKNINRLSERRMDRGGEFYSIYKPNCPDCGQALLWDWDEINKVSIKTKEFREAELKNE